MSDKNYLLLYTLLIDALTTRLNFLTRDNLVDN